MSFFWVPNPIQETANAQRTHAAIQLITIDVNMNLTDSTSYLGNIFNGIFILLIRCESLNFEENFM